MSSGFVKRFPKYECLRCGCLHTAWSYAAECCVSIKDHSYYQCTLCEQNYINKEHAEKCCSLEALESRIAKIKAAQEQRMNEFVEEHSDLMDKLVEGGD